MKLSLFTLSLLILGTLSCGVRCSTDSDSPDNNDEKPPGETTWSAKVVRTVPHDPTAFTQGLMFVGNSLYETTGQYGTSGIRKVDLESGDVLFKADLDSKYFGEGVVYYNDVFYQLTWKSKVAFAFTESGDAFIRKPDKDFTYETQGWGLTKNSDHIIMSDGSSKLYFLNPESKAIIKEINVTMNGQEVTRLNELEWYKDKILANVWQQSYFVEIEPTTGEVTRLVNFDQDEYFTTEEAAHVAGNFDRVLNGIAWDEANDTLYITGKQWSYMYQIEIVE